MRCPHIATALLAHTSAHAWLNSFVKNSDNVPAIKITLEAPKDPYPQVSELRTELEKDRLAIEEKQFESLEQSFNKALELSRSNLKTTLSNSLKVLKDKSTLDKAIKGARPPTSSRSIIPSFRQIDMGHGDRDMRQEDGDMAVAESGDAEDEGTEGDMGDLDDGDGPISLLETGKGVIDTIKSKLSNLAPPTVEVQLLDIYAPESEIEAKIRQIEQKRSSMEDQGFKNAEKSFTTIVKIFDEEVKKNLQIQLNAFLVDTAALSSSINSLGSKASFRQTFDDDSRQRSERREAGFEPLRNVALKNTEPLETALDFFLQPETEVDEQTDDDGDRDGPLSFVETGSAFLNPEQLNVAVGVSDRPYPMVTDIIDEMQKKRDATERLERVKFLQMFSHLMRAQIEMLKDGLHEELASALTLLGGSATAMKEASI